MNSIAYSLYSYRLEIRDLKDKVHTFWEGHKILRNLHCRFVLCSNGQIYGGDFANLCGLLRIYEFYLMQCPIIWKKL